MSPDAELAGSLVITGASGLFFAALGVEPQALVWALVGSVLGVTLAKPTGRIYAIFLFLAATLTTALLGTMASAQWFGGSAMARNSFSVVLGAAFHPIFAGFIGAVPGLVDACKAFVIRRIGGGAQ